MECNTPGLKGNGEEQMTIRTRACPDPQNKKGCPSMAGTAFRSGDELVLVYFESMPGAARYVTIPA